MIQNRTEVIDFFRKHDKVRVTTCYRSHFGYVTCDDTPVTATCVPTMYCSEETMPYLDSLLKSYAEEHRYIERKIFGG